MNNSLSRHFILILLFVTFSTCSRKERQPWFLFETRDGSFGYVDEKGDTMIRAGKYPMIFTDTLEYFANVLDPDLGIIGINQNEEVLFKVFVYDNGPDYISEGLFRIVKEDKIGYADKQGNIIIEPAFTCAYPFQDGKAKVAFDCIIQDNKEHSSWEGTEWFYIDREGAKVE